jgi:O-antigen polymerase
VAGFAALQFLTYYFQKNKPVIRVLLFAVCLAALVAWQSVTGLLSLAAVQWYAHTGTGKKKHRLLLLLLLPLIWLMINKNSISGRWHILTINKIVLLQNFPSPAPAYAMAHNHAQINYFIQHGIQGKAALLADESAFALNDWLQFSIEYGIAGFGVMLILYIAFFILLRQSLKANPKSGQRFWAAVLMPFYVFTFLSYPLHQPFLLSVFICLHGGLLYSYCINHLFTQNHSLKLTMAAIFVLPVVLLSIFICRQRQYENRMEAAIDEWNAGYHNNAALHLASLKKSLGANARFIYHRALYLQLSGKTDSAVIFLNENHPFGCGYQYHLLLGDCCAELNKYGNAKTQYEQALYLTPHKTAAKFKLMKLYALLNNETQATFWAKQIVQQPVKVSTRLADYYIQEAKRQLGQ